MKHDEPLRPFYVHDRPGGGMQCAFNTTILHGVRAALALRDADDPARAPAARHPDVSPHLTFTDWGGHGYATVRASQHELETEFVCIPRPLERAGAEDGGPLRYRAPYTASPCGRGASAHRCAPRSSRATPGFRFELSRTDWGQTPVTRSTLWKLPHIIWRG